MKKILRTAALALVCILLPAAFYLAVVLGQPDPEAKSLQAEQPLLPAMSSPILIREFKQLGILLAEFPAPVMAPRSSSALQFEQGLCQDVPFAEGLARTVTISCRTAEGAAVTITSIYPARALELVPKGDYSFSGTASPTLASLLTVRMENASSIRLHTQSADAIYVVTLPKAAAASLRDVTASLTAYQGE